MLSDKEIKTCIQNGTIGITPYDESLVMPGCYQIHLGKLLLVPKEGQLVDLRNDDQSVAYDRVELSDAGYILSPKSFILGETHESIAVGDDIAALLDGKSTLARLGLSIHQSSTLIHPAQDSHVVTLEIFNAGNFQIKLYPGIKIGKFVFFRSAEKNSENENPAYLGQQETTGARLQDL